MPTRLVIRIRNTSNGTRSERLAASDVILVIMLTIGMVILCLSLSAIVVLESMAVAGCGPTHPCNFQLNTASQLLTPIAGVIGLIATIVLGVVFVRRGAPVWWAPTVGGTLVVIAFVVATVLNHLSTA
jgi:hypothetical protein